MKVKVLLVFVLVLLAGSFVTESDAFTAGGGGNLPGFGKREKEVSFVLGYFQTVLETATIPLFYLSTFILSKVKTLNCNSINFY